MTWTQLQAEPAFGFMVVGLIIVFGPLIAERMRLPGLLGLLVLGAAVGPNVADLFPTFTTLRSIGNIGVLYLTGYPDDVVRRLGIDPGKVTVIRKPFDNTVLSMKVREALDARERIQQRSPRQGLEA